MKILLIEDDQDDIELFEEAMKANGTPYTMDTINDGLEALDYIAGRPGHPDIIILDFNLPKIHGRELVSAIKSSADLSTVPLVVLTTSSAREDIDFAYRRGVDKFFTKPTTLAVLGEIVEAIIALAGKGGSLH
jgi:CheY-like chemotaxis protein